MKTHGGVGGGLGKLGVGLALALGLIISRPCPAQAPAANAPAAPAESRTPILFDTDIGTGIDDAFALGLILSSPKVELRGVTTVGRDAEDRAWMVCRFLTHAGVKDVPVAFGRGEQAGEGIDWQIQYRRHPAVVWNRTVKPSKKTAVEVMAEVLKADAGKVTIVACGPLTNLAALLKEHPEAKGWVKRIVFVPDRLDGERTSSNVTADVAAVDAVLATRIPITVVPVFTTRAIKLDAAARDRLFAARTALTYQVQSLYELWDQPMDPPLCGALAVAVAGGEDVGRMSAVSFSSGPESGKAYKADCPMFVDAKAFAKQFVDRVAGFGPEILPKEPANVSKLVDRGMMPARVHTFEDFETDIEKRWWMSGKLETKDVSPGRGRACRAVLTQDYDDRMGDMKAMYRAVTFNPVPGPPMGANSRLSFRYKITGTGTMRVQLFSLSNGYHRYLTVKDLPQGEWHKGAVDMTQMRRPDGSGGPLALDERIDDIQFYIDPRAELLIDDIVLYDAAPAGETQPFPKNLLYTGWFDTGKQGGEWPGTFEIVPHEKPLTWKAARSVVDAKTGAGHLRIGFRGQRPAGATTSVRFKYHLTADAPAEIGLKLANSKSGRDVVAKVQAAKIGAWAEATVDFPADNGLTAADELHLEVPKGATLLVDDVLVYESQGER